MTLSIGSGPDGRHEQELTSLRRRVAADGFSSTHSCQHCDELTIVPCNPNECLSEPATLAVASREELRQRVADGCGLWSLVSNEVDYEILKHKRDGLIVGTHGVGLSCSEAEELESLARRCSSRRTSEASTLADTCVDHVRVWFHYDDINCSSAHLTMEIRACEDGVGYSIGIEFTVFELPGDLQISNNRYAFAWPPNAHPGSAQSLQLVRAWIQKCALEHGCGILDDCPSSMPSMLLNVDMVDGCDSVTLVELMPGEQQQYLAWSYCWGPDAQKKILTRTTRREFTSIGIGLQELDATIQDAVRVTRELGYRFLWVDALCIIQDDNDFREGEMCRMDDIYENASITIVAARASSVSQGFLTQRQPAGAAFPDQSFKMSYKRPDDQQCALENWVVLTRRELGNWESPEEPWESRAWTLQEHLLSRRQLRFGTRQTSWTCYCSRKPYEDFDDWFRADLEHARTRRIFVKQLGSLGRILQQPDLVESGDDARQDWYHLVETYSRRTLSFHEDRLPAISAVSRRMARVFGDEDEYWCGIWKSNAPWELLWRADMAWEGTNTAEASTHGRGQPSWTWASHRGPVCFPLETPKDTRIDAHFGIITHMAKYESPKHMYGLVKAAQLRVRGLVTTVPFRQQDFRAMGPIWIKADQPEQDELRQSDEDPDGNLKLQRIFRDKGRVHLERLPHEMLANSDSCFRDKQVVLLLVSYSLSFSHGLLVPRGLVLLNEGGNRFSRLGIFYFWGLEPHESGYYGGDFSTEESCAQTFLEFWGGQDSVQEIVLF